MLTLAPRVYISVDFWRRARQPLAAHFLTHMHADHTEGLNDDWRSPTCGAIYCSPATAQLLQVPGWMDDLVFFSLLRPYAWRSLHRLCKQVASPLAPRQCAIA